MNTFQMKHTHCKTNLNISDKISFVIFSFTDKKKVMFET